MKPCRSTYRCILWPGGGGGNRVQYERMKNEKNRTKMCEWVRERYIVMMDGCFWINAPHWCAWQHYTHTQTHTHTHTHTTDLNQLSWMRLQYKSATSKMQQKQLSTIACECYHNSKTRPALHEGVTIVSHTQQLVILVQLILLHKTTEQTDR